MRTYILSIVAFLTQLNFKKSFLPFREDRKRYGGARCGESEELSCKSTHLYLKKWPYQQHCSGGTIKPGVAGSSAKPAGKLYKVV